MIHPLYGALRDNSDGPSGLTLPMIDCQIELMREIIRTPQRYYRLQPFFYREQEWKERKE